MASFSTTAPATLHETCFKNKQNLVRWFVTVEVWNRLQFHQIRLQPALSMQIRLGLAPVGFEKLECSTSLQLVWHNNIESCSCWITETWHAVWYVAHTDANKNCYYYCNHYCLLQSGFPRILESPWKYLNFFLLNSRPWKYLKRGQVLESP